jgi:hypothetical protein
MKCVFYFCFLIIIIHIKSVRIDSDTKTLDNKNLRNKIYRNSTITTISNEIQHNESNIKKVVILYLQFFLIFSVFSFLKIYEEIFRTISVHIFYKYNNFIDVAHNTDIAILENKYVYISDKLIITKSANDNIFDLGNVNYAKIERRIQLYISGDWVDLDFDTMINFYEYEGIAYMQLDFRGIVFTFPKIENKTFYGEVILSN